MTTPRIALSCGDPGGIGPEVLVRALARPAEGTPPFDPVVFGPPEVLERAAGMAGVPAPVEVVPCGGDLPEAEALARAVDACMEGDCAALVTAPIHKARLRDGGWGFVGHTEYLAHRCGRGGRAVMAFGGGRLRVALLTTHLALRDVPAAIHPGEVERVARTFDDGLRRFFGIDRPRIGLCGLNPHAGESGWMGDEEGRLLAPGVAAARAAGIDLSDPLPADTLFPRALRGDLDGIIACYHDQGLGPVKAVDFGRSVNMTLGLPFLRTSPDHGTAYDIAWSGRADAASMAAALRMAVRGAVAGRAAAERVAASPGAASPGSASPGGAVRRGEG